MCDCCCDCPLDLGCIDTCKCLDTEQIADKDGTYTLRYEFNGVTLLLESELKKDDSIVFNIHNLVAPYTYQAVIEDPLCKRIILKKNTIEYDCLQFNTTLTLNHAI